MNSNSTLKEFYDCFNKSDSEKSVKKVEEINLLLFNYILNNISIPLFEIPSMKKLSLEEYYNKYNINFKKDEINKYESYFEKIVDSFDIINYLKEDGTIDNVSNKLEDNIKTAIRYVGHDFGNIINSVYSYIELLFSYDNDYLKSDVEFRELMNKSITRAKIYSDVLTSLIMGNFSKPFKIKYNDSNKYLNKHDKINLILKSADDNMDITSYDFVTIDQILKNLDITKFDNLNPEIKIFLDSDRVYVIDNGRGFDLSPKLEKFFEDYTTKKNGGFGLQLVKKMNPDIRLITTTYRNNKTQIVRYIGYNKEFNEELFISNFPKKIFEKKVEGEDYQINRSGSQFSFTLYEKK